MGIIAYPPVLNAKRIVPLHKAFAAAKRERIRSAKSIGHTKEFLKQAQEARERAEKLEARRQGLLTFKRWAMPEWALGIVDEVCARRDICPSDMASSRKYKAVHARNEAIYFIKARKPSLSSTQIARWFARDHTSILHSLASHSDATGAPALVGYDLAGVRERNRLRAARAE